MTTKEPGASGAPAPGYVGGGPSSTSVPCSSSSSSFPLDAAGGCDCCCEEEEGPVPLFNRRLPVESNCEKLAFAGL